MAKKIQNTAKGKKNVEAKEEATGIPQAVILELGLTTRAQRVEGAGQKCWSEGIPTENWSFQ